MNLTTHHTRLGREPFVVYELIEEDEPVYTLVERFCDQCETRYFPDAEEWRICPTCRREYGLEQ
jgi:hypothetical protein